MFYISTLNEWRTFVRVVLRVELPNYQTVKLPNEKTQNSKLSKLPNFQLLILQLSNCQTYKLSKLPNYQSANCQTIKCLFTKCPTKYQNYKTSHADFPTVIAAKLPICQLPNYQMPYYKLPNKISKLQNFQLLN